MFGSRQGKMGWFPESYVERASPSDAANNVTAAAAPAPKLALQSQLSNALEAVKAAGTKSAFTPTHSPNPAPSDTQGQVRGVKVTLLMLPFDYHSMILVWTDGNAQILRGEFIKN